MRLLMLVGIFALLPTVAAFEADLVPPEDELPIGVAVDVPLSATVDCMDVYKALPEDHLTVRWEAQVPSHLKTDSPQTADVTLDDCLHDESVTVTATMAFTATEATPGETPVEVVVRADLLRAEQPAVFKEFQPVAEWTGAFSYHVPLDAKAAGPQKEIAYQIELTNEGNALAVYHFKLLDHDLRGQVILPEPIILDPAHHGSTETSKVVTVVYLTPFENGENRVDESFTLSVWSASTKDPEKRGPQQTFELNAETKGVYVPGPGLFIALIGVAMASRARR